MYYSVYTNRGKKRTYNEDSYLVIEKPQPVIAVADGMGGHRAGEVASKIAIDTVNDYLFNYEKDLLEQVDDLFMLANDTIMSSGIINKDYHGMGTTLSMGIIYQNRLYFGHIGDSRIYTFRNNRLKQLTTDHSLVNELLQNKQITCKEAFNHPQKHIITQALGTDTALDVNKGMIDLMIGDLLLFCTDGLTDMIKFKSIEAMFKENSNLDLLSNKLGEKALENGGNDNITLIPCQIM